MNIVAQLRRAAETINEVGAPPAGDVGEAAAAALGAICSSAADHIEKERHALRLLLDDIDTLVLRHGFSAAERDSMLSVKTAREILST